MTRFFACLLALLITSTANAQTYPDRLHSGLNDYADIVDADTETSINAKIADIFQEHGVEVSIATLSSVRFYAQDTPIEEYATGLFNTWAIGNVDTNDGMLILVFRDDRELRIEIGSGYDDDTQKQIDRVVDEDILPLFRDENYSAGLDAGVDGLLARVIAPPPANSTAQSQTSDDESSGNALYYVLGAVVAGIAGLIGLNRRNAAKFATQPCSSCGKTGLQKSRDVLRPATVETEGAGETRITCPSCGHVDTTPYKISKLSPKDPEGGGQSKGRWGNR